MTTTPPFLYPARMTLQLDALDGQRQFRFSTLNFPFQIALDAFLSRLRQIDEQYNGKRRYPLMPPTRQLNNAILALAPGLIHAFEDATPRKKFGKMLAFTHPLYDKNGLLIGYEAYPSTMQLADLIRVWLQLWIEEQDLKTLIDDTGQTAWRDLLVALKTPETNWQHNLDPQPLVEDTYLNGGLAYAALPALLTALLHDQKQLVNGARQPFTIKWRRANDGGNRGLHLVSQPFPKDGDYFAFRVDFSVQTQAGRRYNNDKLKPWIDVKLGLQRYITEIFKKDKISRRNLSILMGYNRERFETTLPELWEINTTLIRLGVKSPKNNPQWDDGVGRLLERYGIRTLKPAADILQKPLAYGKYSGRLFQNQDEYYPVFAEGREFGERGRRHRVETGFTLREYNEIVVGLLDMLGGLLIPDEPFELDAKFPKGARVPLALRSHQFFRTIFKDKHRKDKTPIRIATDTGLKQALIQNRKHSFHLAILYQDKAFEELAREQIHEVLFLSPTEEPSLVTITAHYISPSLSQVLDNGGLDPDLRYDRNRPNGFFQKWEQQMRRSYTQKREDWRNFLKTIAWEDDAIRLALIDSKGDEGDQSIKGAVRDACHRESIASQFLIGSKLTYANGNLKDGAAATMRNAALDLLIRQPGVLYGSPAEVYQKIIGFDETIASQLDVIAFCRIEKNFPYNVHYALAVRLRADGQIDVLLPGSNQDWLSYLEAAQKLGRLFSDTRGKLGQNHHDLRLTQGDLATFVHDTLVKPFARPTIAVIEAVGWRNGPGDDETEHGWKQLRNSDLMRRPDTLDFPKGRFYQRNAPAFHNLLAVIRLRMDDETPQYTTEEWRSEDDVFDLPDLTGYVDTSISEPLHYFSVAGLSRTQKDQKIPRIRNAYKLDPKESVYDDIPIKHSQLVELVPFFVRPDFNSDSGKRQLCRVLHFQRVAPAFIMGEVLLPYPMHLGNTLLEDQLCVIGADS